MNERRRKTVPLARFAYWLSVTSAVMLLATAILFAYCSDAFRSTAQANLAVAFYLFVILQGVALSVSSVALFLAYKRRSDLDVAVITMAACFLFLTVACIIWWWSRT